MSEATGIDPRLPTPDRDSQAWWDALARHEFVLQRCDDCQAWRWPSNSTPRSELRVEGGRGRMRSSSRWRACRASTGRGAELPSQVR